MVGRTLGALAAMAGAMGCGASAMSVAGEPGTGEGAGAGDPSCELVSQGHGPKGPVAVRAEVVVTGLEVPWSLAFMPGGDMLVTERAGRIRVVRDGKLSAPIAHVPVAASGEGGLLGLAIAPDFATSRHFFIYFTAEEGGATTNRVERWTLAQDGRSASRDRTILGGIPAARFHDGGRLRIGPDGMLYVATGDARDPELARSQDSLAGKLLRLRPDGSVPDDNPFAGSPVYVSGLRNLQAFDWLQGKTLALADHGPSGELGRKGHDEISVAKAGDDLGWPTIFGCQTRTGLVTPKIAWVTATPPGGAAFYTGTAIPAWRDSLIVGTLGSKHLHRVVFDGPDAKRVTLHEVYFEGDRPAGYGRLRDVVMGPDGELYVTTSNCDGRGECPAEKDVILRITK